MERKDAWTYEEDLTLAQTVLEHIENGSTQLNAFEEVGERLKRTSAACGFRWNSAIRSKYKEDILKAKQHRNKKKSTKAVGYKGAPSDVTEIYVTIEQQHKEPTMEVVIRSLKRFKEEYNSMKQKISTLQKRVQDLTTELKESANKAAPVDDMQNLMQIIRRAEQLGLFEKLNTSNKEKPAG